MRVSLRRPRHVISRYGIAILSVAISTLISILLRPHSFLTPYLFFYPGILIALMYGGLGPGWFATVLSAISVYYFQLPPYGEFAFDVAHVFRTLFFVFSFGLVCWLIESRRKSSALQAGKDRVAAIVASAMDAIVTLDQNQRIVIFNAAAEKMFGWNASRAVGESVDILIPERFRQRHRGHVNRFSTSGDTSRTMNSLTMLMGLRSDGTEFPFEATISKETVGGEKLLTAILRDMTQRKQSEEALIRSEKLASLGRLAASIAHEVNNPLDAIGNLLFLLETTSSTSESGLTFLRSAQSELARVVEICHRTLGFSKNIGSVSRFRPTALVHSLVELHGHKIRKKKITLETEFLTDAEVTGIETDIRQVLWNLLGNALDAVPLGGKIKVRVSDALTQVGPPGVRITVADNGTGITITNLPHLFEPFFTTKPSGNGLGLWVISEILKRQGGKIWVRSRSRPKGHTGAVFSVFLPANTQSPPPC